MQVSLTSLWGKSSSKRTENSDGKRTENGDESQKRKGEPLTPISSSKRLKSFHRGAAGIDIDQKVRSHVEKKLGGLDALDNIKRRSKRKGEPVPLKPLHQQILKIKLDNWDTLLFVEEGYKYKIYADDAVVVSKILGFYLSDGRKHFEEGHEGEDEYETFSTCSFPVQSLQMHTKRFVDLGYKVGIVQQMEQAALKKSGKLMDRALTRKYTKATFADEFSIDTDANDGHASANGPSSTSYMMAIAEAPQSSSSSGKFGIVAVEPSTGDIVYDEFEDGLMLTELETRMLHIQPCEVIFIGEPSSRTKKLVSTLSSNTSNIITHTYGDLIHNEYHTMLISHFTEEMDKVDKNYKPEIGRVLDMVKDQFSSAVQLCLHGLIVHLEEYQMSHIFSIYKNYSTFSAHNEMYLSGDTLMSLEIFQNQHERTVEGSLFALLDQTRTPFGRRLLRKWVAKPLMNKIQIDRRLEAVSELTKPHSRAGWVATAVRTCPDLEKVLANIYYGRSSRPQLYMFLKKVQEIAFIEDRSAFKSEYLNDLFGQLPKCREIITRLLSKIDIKWYDHYSSSNKSDDIELFFDVDAFDSADVENASYADVDLFMRKMAVIESESAMENYLKEVKDELKIPIVYGTHIDVEYVFEIDVKYKTRIPNDWIPYAKSAKKHKYRSPQLEKLFTNREKQKSLLKEECQTVYKLYLGQVARYYNEFRELVSALSQIDCIMSLANLARHDHYTRPELSAGSTAGIQVVGGRHPVAEQSIDIDYIANDIDIDQHNRVKIVTGPNMGGKSSYVRQVALIAIMAQIGSYVPAQSATIGPFDAVFTRMGAYDNMIRGQSTFKVELQECGTIMNKATSKSLVILDEVGRGTSTTDGHAIAHAVLSYFVTDIHCATLFITHYPALASFATAFPSTVGCYRMGFEQDDSESDSVRFTYKLESGVAKKSYGLNVARIARLPQNVLDQAASKSKAMDQQISQRHDQRALIRQSNFIQSLGGENFEKSQIVEILQSLT